MFYDVIVLGAGLAGLMAAEVASCRGARVLVLAQGMGSLPLTTGCIDALGYFPPSSSNLVDSPSSALPKLIEEFPSHPYALAGLPRIAEAFAYFQKLSHEIGLPYSGSLSSNFLIPTPLGTFHPTCLIPETMALGDLKQPEPALLLGFSGLKDFSPLLIAANLNRLKSLTKRGSRFRAETLKEINLEGKALNSLNLAAAFDRKKFRKEIAKQIRPLLNSEERLGLPAVIGWLSPQEALADLQNELLTKVFEIPLLPPSVPGLRLQKHLRQHLQNKGVRILIGLSSLLPHKDGDRLIGFTLGNSKYSPSFKAASFVLATGKFVGGGLEASREGIKETLLDLPLSYPPRRREWFNENLLDLSGQPFNKIGIDVNSDLQPLDLHGCLVYKNLFAAGGIIGHCDSLSEKSGGGVAITTGYLAGELAVRFAGF